MPSSAAEPLDTFNRTKSPVDIADEEEQPWIGLKIERPPTPEEDSEYCEDSDDDSEDNFEVNYVDDSTTSMKKYYGLSIAQRLLQDQSEKIKSSADMHIVCKDGLVPFHRYILMAASKFVTKLLKKEDPSELAVIHLPDVNVLNAAQVIFLLYSGQAAYKKSDEDDIHTVFKLLRIDTKCFQSNESNVADAKNVLKLRFYEKPFGEADYITRFLHNDHQEIPTSDAGNKTLGKSDESDLQGCDQMQGLSLTTSDRKLDEKGTTRNGVNQTINKLQCNICGVVFVNEEGFANHVSTTSATELSGKYSFNDNQKQCQVCQEIFPNYSLCRLISHVETCKGLHVAFKDTNVPEFIVENNSPNAASPSQLLPPQGTTEPSDESKEGRKKRGRKRRNSGKRRNSIKTVNARELSENLNENELLATGEKEDQNEITGIINEDALLEDNVNYPPARKFARRALLNSSASGPSSSGNIMRSPSRSAIVIPDLEQQEEIEYIAENDPSGYSGDISSMTSEDLKLFLNCPVCKLSFRNIHDASKCVRKHGLKRCWICLKLIPNDAQQFHQHIVSKHVFPGSERKVQCSFCQKVFDCNTGIAIHMGHYHFPLFKKSTNDAEGNKAAKSKKIRKARKVKAPTENTSDGFAENTSGLAENTSGLAENTSGLAETTVHSCGSSAERIINDNDDTSFTLFCSGGNDDETPNFVQDRSNNGGGTEGTDGDDEDSGDKDEPEKRNSVTAEQNGNNPPSTTTFTGLFGRTCPGVVPSAPPTLGRVLLDTKEIGGEIYNVYGLINPTSNSNGPKNNFSKVIAILKPKPKEESNSTINGS